MHPDKKALLKAAGIELLSEAEFFGLTPEQEAMIELKVRLSAALRRARKAAGLTQTQLAERLGSPQQTVARLETVHPSVSIDLLVRALLVAGCTVHDIASEFRRAADYLQPEQALPEIDKGTMDRLRAIATHQTWL